MHVISISMRRVDFPDSCQNSVILLVLSVTRIEDIIYGYTLSFKLMSRYKRLNCIISLWRCCLQICILQSLDLSNKYFVVYSGRECAASSIVNRVAWPRVIDRFFFVLFFSSGERVFTIWPLFNITKQFLNQDLTVEARNLHPS